MPSIRQKLLTLATLAHYLMGSSAAVATDLSQSSLHEGMVLIPGGTFEMGGDPGLMGGGSQSHGTSYPIHEVTVDSFWMDQTEVTNAEFAKFVEATGYVTLAERPLPAEYVELMSRAAETQIRELEALLPQLSGRDKAAALDRIERVKEASTFGETAGAIVFALPEEVYGQNDYTQWWRVLPGANWRSPEGPGSTWIGREDHPVVNVTPEDAAAYAKWAGKRLPTEAEWERAARGGLARKPYVWGTEFAPQGDAVWMANIWQGAWPYENTGEDGFVGTAPVKQFPPNAFGLYDISGNIWEIVADRFY
ncbi:MAG: SUMF1/EgtB/PvdO family nonheme iron enzyme, partial [Coraliomargarita sp.]